MKIEMKTRRTQEEGDRRSRGYSLPELLIVIAIIGLFVLFGGPAMQEAYRAYRVRASANELVTVIRGLRYNAVAGRAPRTMTLNNQNATPPNQYTFPNAKGDTVTARPEFVNFEPSSAASLTFVANGSTGVAGNTTVLVSGWISDSRNDRYTITVTSSGTVSSAYSTF
jgi:prepilin-type N-terminal cleavage/methylation domain-containing protein